MFMRTLDALIVVILRVDIAGMEDAATGKFLIPRLVSRRGDKLLYDDKATLVFTVVLLLPLEVGNISLVMPDLELLTDAWSLTQGCSINWAAVGRAAGSRCKQSFRKLFASEERWSGISGMSLLFPILNIAATCDIDYESLADNHQKTTTITM
jgi:hypothetical protein